jgi:transposase
MATLSRRTVGLDVSDRFTSYCVLGDDGEIVEEGKIRTTPFALAERFLREDCRFVLEAGTHSPWISRLFSETGREVVVANPRRVQLIAQSARKPDRTDAEALTLAAALPSSTSPSKGPSRAHSACSRAVSTRSACSERETCQPTM